MGRVKLLLANLAVTLALLALCAAAGEAWLRSVPERNDAAQRDDGSTKYRFNPYRSDGVLGYAHRPDWETVHETEEFRVTVRTNALGLRGGPSAAKKARDTYRVLVIGDSFAFGFGVEDDQTFAAVLGCSSGVIRPVEFATSDGPVVTATYCLPLTAKVTGKPLTGAPRLTSHRTLPVRSSSALKRPFESPPNTSPPPVATSDSMPARCSCFQSVLPVSAEIAHTVPTFVAPGAITPGMFNP